MVSGLVGGLLSASLVDMHSGREQKDPIVKNEPATDREKAL